MEESRRIGRLWAVERQSVLFPNMQQPKLLLISPCTEQPLVSFVTTHQSTLSYDPARSPCASTAPLCFHNRRFTFPNFDSRDQEDKQMKCAYVDGAIIVGAGPSGLAVSACLSQQGVPSLILEKSDCIASLWQHKTYDRLKLHLPKQFCQLPLFGFPKNFPKYPTKQQFIDYMETYASHFSIHPKFKQAVLKAVFDSSSGSWKVQTQDCEYISKWLIVATGENAEPVKPEILGIDKFNGPIVHTSEYKSGSVFRNQRVLVVGCGNSGMEVSLDLCRNNAIPHMVVRNTGCDFFTKEGMPKTPFPKSWKGDCGLYTVGFTKRGLLGTAFDADKIAKEISDQWRSINDCNKSCNSHVILLKKS
ncbi:hypothetical protein Q3G72_004719 [Acer saccharum]|nr:hypothetical protein Q3G72_004719 [Acer saccharum]